MNTPLADITKSHWQLKAFVVLTVIIAFYITRSTDCTCKAVAQIKLVTQLRNLQF